MANEAIRLIGGGGEASAPSGEELNLREIWRALMRRKLVLLGVVVLLTGLTFAVVSRQTPLYTAETLIHVKPQDAQVIQIEGVVE
jgi:uncharacterized protein involved in exopolysaccharide biosynthesis